MEETTLHNEVTDRIQECLPTYHDRLISRYRLNGETFKAAWGTYSPEHREEMVKNNFPSRRTRTIQRPGHVTVGQFLKKWQDPKVEADPAWMVAALEERTSITYEEMNRHDYEEVLRMCDQLSVPQKFAKRITVMKQYNEYVGLCDLMDMVIEHFKFFVRYQYPSLEDSTPLTEEGYQSHDLTELKIRSTLSRPPKPDLANMVATAEDHHACMEDYRQHLLASPDALDSAIVFRLKSLPKEKRDWSLVNFHNVLADKELSSCLFAEVHWAYRNTATWEYVKHLISFLEKPTHRLTKAGQSTVLQGIANVLHLYVRETQIMLRDNLYMTAPGMKDNQGKRVIGVADIPEALVVAEPQLYYLLHICSPNADAPAISKLIQRLYDYHDVSKTAYKLHPKFFDFLAEIELAVKFLSDLSTIFTVPAVSPTKCRAFVTKFREIRDTLNEVSKELDLDQFLVPRGMILQADMAEGALDALEKFVKDRTGTTIGERYQSTVNECIGNLFSALARAASASSASSSSSAAPLGGFGSSEAGATTTMTTTTLPRIRKGKTNEKTRPVPDAPPPATATATATAKDRSDGAGTPAEKEQWEEAVAAGKAPIRVRKATQNFFSDLFTKSESRGGFQWSAFESAMADVGFSVRPGTGSACTYYPPESLALTRSVTFHRPHHPQRLEGRRLKNLAARLNRVFGWTEDSFESLGGG